MTAARTTFAPQEIAAIEKAFGVKLPAGFGAEVDRLAARLTTDLRGVFVRPEFVTTVAEVRRLHRHEVPHALVPFLADRQGAHVDYYAFDRKAQPRVVVFALHAVVHEWPDFGAFLGWVDARPRGRQRLL